MASEEDVLLREVDEDLSRDQAFENLEKWRVPLIGGAAAIIAGVTGWQFFDGRQTAAANAAAEAYAPLSFAAEGQVTSDQLSSFAADNESGFATLAALRAAAALGVEGDLETARDLYAAIYEDSSASTSLRDYARIRAAYLLFDKRTEEAATLAAQVETTAFRPFAEEIASSAVFLAGDYAAAKAGFDVLASSSTAPASIKTRAQAFALVADAALNGAVVAPPADETAGSFIERLGAELNASGIPTGAAELPPLPNLDILTEGAAPADGLEPLDDASEEPQTDEPEETP